MSKNQTRTRTLTISPDVAYNEPFFTALANAFLFEQKRKGDEAAYKLIAQKMERNLGLAYDALKAGKNSTPEAFAKAVGARDASVGLKVRFDFHSPKDFSYAFLTDPFPMLAGKADPEKLFDTFMKFKVKRLLGNRWSHQYEAFAWMGASETRVRIRR